MTSVAFVEEQLERYEELRELELAKATGRDPWRPRPHQVAPDGNWYLWLLLAGRGAGKLLDANTEIPTPAGWSLLGDLGVGDLVFDESGRRAPITAVFDDLPERSYRLTFSDGSIIDACSDHLWVTWDHRARKAYTRSQYESIGLPEDWPEWRSKRATGVVALPRPVIEDALEIIGSGTSVRATAKRLGVERGALARHVQAGSYVGRPPRIYPDSPGPCVRTTKEIVDTFTHGTRGDLNHSIPVCGPLDLPERKLPLDPYVLGAWLGDGSKGGGQFTAHPSDHSHWYRELAAFSPHPTTDPKTVATYGLSPRLRAAGVITRKHVPAVYLRASAAQRLALLQGLMDTDGCATRTGAEFTSTTRDLADAVAELARSLGQKPVISEGRSTLYGRDCGPKWRVLWRPTIDVFRMDRKASAVPPLGAQANRNFHRMIVDWEEIPSVPMRCLSVASRNSTFLAGRAMIPTHNTDACAVYFDRWMRRHAGARGAIIAPTLGDAFEACIYGPSGLLVHNPSVSVRSRAGGTIVLWPNGSVAKMFGTHSREDVERLRAGGNRGIVWAEELAAWRYLREAWEQMEFGLRVGPRPHVIASTTPKPKPMLKKLMESAETVISRASTFDNPHLPEEQRERVRQRYEGTRLARQELFGEYIDEVEGALWTYETLEASHAGERWDGQIPSLARVVVGVDPSGGDEEGNDEQGIIVCGRGVDGLYYVLADRSCKLSPDGWGKRVCQAYDEFRADAVLWEANFGGQMVESTVRIAARDMGLEVNTKKVTASRGKVVRAEPIAALYEQGKVRHVGDLELLESQMRSWTPDSGWSPDRMDAMVWALSELGLGHQATTMRTYVARKRIPTAADRFQQGYGI